MLSEQQKAFARILDLVEEAGSVSKSECALYGLWKRLALNSAQFRQIQAPLPEDLARLYAFGAYSSRSEKLSSMMSDPASRISCAVWYPHETPMPLAPAR